MGLTKFSGNHPLGFVGCVMVAGGIGSITSGTMFIQALISYERRRAITGTTYFKYNFGIYIFLALAFIFPFGFWIVYMTIFEAAVVFNVKVAPDSNDTILVCNPANAAFIGANEIIFTMQGFVVPTIIIVYNYLPIWKLALRQYEKPCDQGDSSVFVVVQKKRQIRLAIIMSFTVLEFFIFYLPQFCIVMATVYQKATGSLTISNNVTTFGWGLWFLDAIFNPLWTTFISKKKQTDKKPIEILEKFSKYSTQVSNENDCGPSTHQTTTDKPHFKNGYS